MTEIPSPSGVYDCVGRAVRDDSPYPHLVAEAALPGDIADTLVREMPPVEVLTQGVEPGSNQRFWLPSKRALDDPRPSAAWKAALQACNEALPGFLRAFIRRFRENILATYPDFEERFGPVDELRMVPRREQELRRGEIGMDAQMVVNTPALTDGTSVRTAHLDRADKLISGLLYLRAPGDDSTGAELELYEAGEGPIELDGRNHVIRGEMRPVRRYPYRHNLLVLPLNTPNAYHGVTPRGRTPHPRFQIHIVGEMPEALFAPPRRPAG